MNFKTAMVMLGLTFVAAGCGSNPVAPPPGVEGTTSRPFELAILHINDHHSHLDAENIALQLETSPGKREAINVERGGFPRVTAAIKELEKKSDNVIKIHSGDASTGDLYYTLNEGKADAELMNTVCFDTFNLGNHEFDNTDAGVKK